MSTTAAAVGASRVPDTERLPVKWWAALGVTIQAFQAFVLVRWISGPYFVSVDPATTPLTGWMKVALTYCQIVLPIAGMAVLYWFVFRLWRREGRVGLDGRTLATFIVRGRRCR